MRASEHTCKAMRGYPAAVGIVCCLLASACDTAEPDIICTLEARAGIVVEVRDAVTDEGIAGVVGILTDGDFIETMFIPEEDHVIPQLSGAYERAGTYEVIVAKAGYTTWRKRNVTVERGECHVMTVRLEARLERE